MSDSLGSGDRQKALDAGTLALGTEVWFVGQHDLLIPWRCRGVVFAQLGPVTYRVWFCGPGMREVGRLALMTR
jgi:hypothetical protein